MATTNSKAALTLSWVIAALELIQSAGGLAFRGAYRDGAWVRAAWGGNDLVTLVVAVPLLISSLVLAGRGSERARIVWFGMLLYALYNDAFYLFGAALNRFFILYPALFALSIFALISGLGGVDLAAIGRRFRPTKAVRWISALMMLFAAGVAATWIGQFLQFVFTGRIPLLGGTEQGYSLVAALDLSLQVPSLVLGAIWLWKRQPRGYLFATALLIADATYLLVLVAFSPFAAQARLSGAWSQAPGWAGASAACLVGAVLLLACLREDNACADGARHAQLLRGAKDPLAHALESHD